MLFRSTFRRRARSSTPPGTKSKCYKSGGTELRSKTGKPALLLDIGSVGNLSGDQFAREQTKEVIAQSNTVFFQMMGIAALIVAFLCWFFLKEPQGSFAEHHEGEEEEIYTESVI